MASVESDRNIVNTSVTSTSQASRPDSLASDSFASIGCGSGGNLQLRDSSYTLARMAQSANLLRLNTSLEQLRNLDLYSRLMPALSSSSINPTINSSNVDLLTRLLYRDALNNVNDNSPQPTFPNNSVAHALTPLQQLLGQHQQASTVALPVIPNSVLSSSPSILEAARTALLQHQQQQHDQQRLATSSNMLSTILSSNNSSNNTELLVLRLAIANGYSSVDQYLLDVMARRNASLANDSNQSSSAGNDNN